jgi:RimJ/RimL family protein N-acetyltransferase
LADGQWHFILKGTDAERVLIGIGGFKGCPNEAGVDVGYSIFQQCRNAGYGSEATAGLVNWPFKQQAGCALAETLPELKASVRALQENGFSYADAGSEQGIILYRKDRPV